MNWIALKILVGDKSKYIGLIFGVAFATLLIAQQCSIFDGVMDRTASFILDFRDVDIWVMDATVDNLDIVEPMRNTALSIVRGVPGVKWAVPLLKIPTIAKPFTGRIHQVMVVGLDDASLVGAPRKMVIGHWNDLRKPNAIILDTIGYNIIWPEDKGHFQLGKVLEISDNRAILVGVVDVIPAFQFMPIVYTQYKNALAYTYGGRNRMSFVLVKSQEGFQPEQVVKNINAMTPFRAMTRQQFRSSTVWYYIKNTGIPVNFAVTVTLGLIVGAAIVGLLLNMFVSDNVKQFAALKVMGLENRRLMKLVLLQALVVFVIGYSIGIGVSALLFSFTIKSAALKGIYMPWYIAVLTGILNLIVIVISSLFSLNRVMRIDPAIVFKG